MSGVKDEEVKMETMRCVEIADFGGPEVLRLAERPAPRPGPGEVLIRVEAAGVSRPDVLQRRGLYPPPPGASDLPGLEVAGTIAGLGPGAADHGLVEGMRVAALLAGGGYAELATAPVEQVLPIPEALSAVEAAALPENFFTVWTNVFERGRLRAGESLLVHGGASGIGTTAIALGRAFGARVYATAGGPKKCAACERLGAERAFDYRTQDFVAEVAAATRGRGVDVVLDMVAGDYAARNLEVLAPEGRLVFIAFQGGPIASVNVMHLMAKRLTLTGSTLRARTPAEKGAIAAALRAQVWPLLATRTVLPTIDSTFPLARAAEAHQRLEAGAHVGKIVLTIG